MKHIEDDNQLALMQWARSKRFNGARLSDYLHHSPNGGKRDVREAARLKAQGVLAGFPDLFLFVPRGQWHGLMIEMKSPKGRLSPAQTQVLPRIEGEGYRVEVCYSVQAAIDVISDYLEVAQ